MIENGMLPYVMISENNTAGKNLQMRFGAQFAKEKCYFFAKGAYEFE
ncbi:hypothetical protein [Ruminococcus sp. YE282]|jgi:hypothetical protein|nr:hypothetical protein [Ruminococcus bromii]MEE0963401.1 hypothetical protein [Ruminococcus bromii]MEE3498922.1 hypothetical protein [Ruminococcus bromii]